MKQFNKAAKDISAVAVEVQKILPLMLDSHKKLSNSNFLAACNRLSNAMQSLRNAALYAHVEAEKTKLATKRLKKKLEDTRKNMNLLTEANEKMKNPANNAK